MKTKLIGLKELRQNLSEYAKEVTEKKIHIIVLNKNKPILEIQPVDSNVFDIEHLRKEVAEARKQVKQGKIHSQKEVQKMFE